MQCNVHRGEGQLSSSGGRAARRECIPEEIPRRGQMHAILEAEAVAPQTQVGQGYVACARRRGWATRQRRGRKGYGALAHHRGFLREGTRTIGGRMEAVKRVVGALASEFGVCCE
jgi:hypothetical protein